MSIGILVYSLTGNTLSVAEKIKEELKQKGKSAVIERITILGETQNGAGSVVLKHIPDLSNYDTVIIGSPINAFSLSVPMKKYLKLHADVKGKQLHCFVTQYFKHPILGGNKGIRQIKNLCLLKGGTVQKSAIVHWSSPNREEQIKEAVKKLSDI